MNIHELAVLDGPPCRINMHADIPFERMDNAIRIFPVQRCPSGEGDRNHVGIVRIFYILQQRHRVAVLSGVNGGLERLIFGAVVHLGHKICIGSLIDHILAVLIPCSLIARGAVGFIERARERAAGDGDGLSCSRLVFVCIGMDTDYIDTTIRLERPACNIDFYVLVVIIIACVIKKHRAAANDFTAVADFSCTIPRCNDGSIGNLQRPATHQDTNTRLRITASINRSAGDI